MDITYKDAIKAADERLAELKPAERLSLQTTRDILRRRINQRTPMRPMSDGEIEHLLYHLGTWLNEQEAK